MYNMKKLILLLLISGGLTAQVVVPKSTTTFSNVSATGTLKVASTSTLVGKVRVGANTAPSATLDVTGTMSVSGTTTLSTLVVNSATAAIFDNPAGSNSIRVQRQSGAVEGKIQSSSTGVQIGAVSSHPTEILAGNTAYASLSTTGVFSTTTLYSAGASTLTGAAKQTNTLNYEGNTTWNTNQTNTLTTGNTGTVAVLSDAVFPVNLSLGNFNVSDGSSYYLGNIPISGFSFAGAGTGTVVLPYNCTLVSWQYYTVTGGTLGSGESYTLQVAGTTTVNLSSVITNTTTYVGFSGSGLSTNFAANDVMNVKLIAPSLATNPTSVYAGITLWFVRRQ